MAAQALWKLASRTNTKLRLLLLNLEPGPGLRAEIERSPCAPANVPFNPTHRKALIARFAKLGLAQNSEVNVAGKFDSDAPMSRAVVIVYFDWLRPLKQNQNYPGPKVSDGSLFPGWTEWAKANAAKIPQELTRENSRKWANLAEPLLKILWGERFEEHPQFAMYRKSKALEGATTGKLRDHLRKVWRQSWSSMANP